jgi:hypothetical protein
MASSKPSNLSTVAHAFHVLFLRHVDSDYITIDRGKPPLLHELVVDVRTSEHVPFRGEPQRDDKGHKSSRHHRHIAHVLRRSRHDRGKAVQDIKKDDPSNCGGVDVRPEAAKLEVALGQDLLAAAI